MLTNVLLELVPTARINMCDNITDELLQMLVPVMRGFQIAKY
jgi:hypothetical protein